MRIIRLPLALPRWSSNLPGSSEGHGRVLASLFGLAPQGVCHAVAAHAGRGALLPHHFTLTSRRSCERRGAVSFCCTFRRVAAPGRYPACCPLEFGLSSAPCDAAILRSALRMGCNHVDALENPGLASTGCRLSALGTSALPTADSREPTPQKSIQLNICVFYHLQTMSPSRHHKV